MSESSSSVVGPGGGQEEFKREVSAGEEMSSVDGKSSTGAEGLKGDYELRLRGVAKVWPSQWWRIQSLLKKMRVSTMMSPWTHPQKMVIHKKQRTPPQKTG